MYLHKLRFQHLRNHDNTEINCPEGILFLLGENAAGKTTVLEAVSLLCMTRSFISNQDRTLLNVRSETFDVNGDFYSDVGVQHRVQIQYPNQRMRKNIVLDHESITLAADLIGKFPVVTLSPQHYSLITDGPAERRAFIDVVLSQAHHNYLVDLFELRKILKHRNALLTDVDKNPTQIKTLLEPWNESFSQIAIRVMKKRIHFLQDFTPYFTQSYNAITRSKEQSSLKYKSSIEIDLYKNVDEQNQSFLKKLNDSFGTEYRRGTTIIGPHRDDLEILINDMDVRTQASQGQVKTILVALKIAEFFYLENQLNEKPIMLLDDVFSELDPERLEGVLKLVDGLGQTFITSVNESAIQHFPNLNHSRAIMKVQNGCVVHYSV